MVLLGISAAAALLIGRYEFRHTGDYQVTRVFVAFIVCMAVIPWSS